MTKEVKKDAKTDAKKDVKKEAPVKYTVVFDKEAAEWVIKKSNAERAIRRVKTKEEALKIAKTLSENNDASLTVHKKDGKFQKQ